MKLSSKPLRDTKADAALFVDREHEVERILRALDADLNVLVLGSHGSGRTSLLKHLGFLLRTGRREPHVFLEGRIAEDAPTFLSLLRFRLLEDAHVTAGEALTRSARAAAGVFSGDAAISLQVPRHETEEMLALYADVKAVASRKPGCVVLVDELSSAELTHTLFGRFRDETWELPLRWVVAGDAEARATYLSPPADAFFEAVVDIAPLSDEAAETLLSKRVEGRPLSARDRQKLIEMGKGHPQQLLAVFRRVLIDGLKVDDLGALREWQAARLAELGPAARRLFEDLETYGPASASDPDLLERLGWSRGRAAQVFGQLERARLVRSSSQRSPAGGPDRKVFELRSKR